MFEQCVLMAKRIQRSYATLIFALLKSESHWWLVTGWHKYKSNHPPIPRLVWVSRNCLCKCAEALHALIVCACLCVPVVCVAAVRRNLRSVHAPLLQTQWLFVPNITVQSTAWRMPHMGARSCWFTGSHLKHTGLVLPLRRGYTQNHKMDGWRASQSEG